MLADNNPKTVIGMIFMMSESVRKVAVGSDEFMIIPA